MEPSPSMTQWAVACCANASSLARESGLRKCSDSSFSARTEERSAGRAVRVFMRPNVEVERRQPVRVADAGWRPRSMKCQAALASGRLDLDGWLD